MLAAMLFIVLSNTGWLLFLHTNVCKYERLITSGFFIVQLEPLLVTTISTDLERLFSKDDLSLTIHACNIATQDAFVLTVTFATIFPQLKSLFNLNILFRMMLENILKKLMGLVTSVL